MKIETAAIFAGILFITIIALSSIILYLIRYFTKTQVDDETNLTTIDKAPIEYIVIIHQYIEYLIIGLLFGIVCLNFCPTLAEHFIKTFKLKNNVISIYFALVSIYAGASILWIFFSILSGFFKPWLNKQLDKIKHKCDDEINMKGFVLIFIMSLHSFMEGMNIGLQASIITRSTLLIVIVFHEIFVLPLLIIKAFPLTRRCYMNTSILIIIIYYSLCSPMGVLVGAYLNNLEDFSVIATIDTICGSILLALAIENLMRVLSTKTTNNNDEESNYTINWILISLFLFGFFFFGSLSYFKYF